MQLIRIIFVAAIAAKFGWCQTPLISANGIVNAASYQSPVAYGSIVSIFGQNLAQITLAANTVPLPLTLGGTSVTVNGYSAYLFYVSPTQVNVQLPTAGTSAVTEVSVVVTTAAGSSEPVSVARDPSFGIFTAAASGCGQGAALNFASDGSESVNGPSNSAAPGDYIAVFGTGFEDYYPAPPDNVSAPSNPLWSSIYTLSGDFDIGANQVIKRPSWGGRAPGFIGLDQANVSVPTGVREGCAVPFFVTAGGLGPSQLVTLSIHTGRGTCVDPPSAAYGRIKWERTVATGTGQDGETDTLTAYFPSAPGEQAPPPLAYVDGNDIGNAIVFSDLPSLSCPVSGYRGLNPGTLTGAGPSFGPIQALQTSMNGWSIYEANLPAGTIQPGSFTVNGTGSVDMGSFLSTIQIGSGITVTSQLLPGQVIQDTMPFTVTWTGGDPNTWVTVRLVTASNSAYVQARTSAGTATFHNEAGLYPTLLAGQGPTAVVFEVTPDPSQTPNILIPGVSLGTTHAWKYTYQFGGLTIN